jgi:hypothetical protein
MQDKEGAKRKNTMAKYRSARASRLEGAKHKYTFEERSKLSRWMSADYEAIRGGAEIIEEDGKQLLYFEPLQRLKAEQEMKRAQLPREQKDRKEAGSDSTPRRQVEQWCVGAIRELNKKGIFHFGKER